MGPYKLTVNDAFEKDRHYVVPWSEADIAERRSLLLEAARILWPRQSTAT